MKLSEKAILEGIKTALIDGKATVNMFESATSLDEASAITGARSPVPAD